MLPNVVREELETEMVQINLVYKFFFNNIFMLSSESKGSALWKSYKFNEKAVFTIPEKLFL